MCCQPQSVGRSLDEHIYAAPFSAHIAFSCGLWSALHPLVFIIAACSLQGPLLLIILRCVILFMALAASMWPDAQPLGGILGACRCTCACCFELLISGHAVLRISFRTEINSFHQPSERGPGRQRDCAWRATLPGRRRRREQGGR